MSSIVRLGPHDTRFIQTEKGVYFDVNYWVKVSVCVVLLSLSVLCFLCDYYDVGFVKNIRQLSRIKRNLDNYNKLIDEKIGVEEKRAKLLAMTRPGVSRFKCYDMGQYYIAGRINPISYLPEFVRRGDGGVWEFTKGDNVDLPEKRFCEYITNSSPDTITCGKDMLDKLGYVDYFEPNSPCSIFLSFLFSLKDE